MQAGNHVSGVGSGSYSNSCGAGSLRAKVMLDISSLKGFARRSMTSAKNRVGGLAPISPDTQAVAV